jgi:acyl-CoA thioesterase-1
MLRRRFHNPARTHATRTDRIDASATSRKRSQLTVAFAASVVWADDLWLSPRMIQSLGRWCVAALLVSACSDDGDEPGAAAGGAATGVAGSGASGSPVGVAGVGGNDNGAGNDAGTGGATVAGSGGGGGSGTLRGVVRIANPLVSRGAMVFSQPSGGNLVVDGNYHSNGWYIPTLSADAPAWVALQLPAGPSRLLLSWDDGGTYNYEDTAGTTVYGLPGAYHIDVSADSTNGEDGTWETVADVPANSVRTRAHAFGFSGKSWVKMVVTAAPPGASNGAVSIGEIDLHDISTAGSGLPEDTWFFMGDSITAFAYDRASIHAPSFAQGINDAVPNFFPAMINGGIGGETTTNALARIAHVLELNADYRFFILGYGTNDAAGGQVPVATFKSNLQSLIDQIEALGHEPIIPHIPPSSDGSHATIPDYNSAIDELTTANDLVPGADLYEYFTSTDGLFTCPPCAGGRMTDNLHPNDDGLKGMNAQWSSAMRHIYPE